MSLQDRIIDFMIRVVAGLVVTGIAYLIKPRNMIFWIIVLVLAVACALTIKPEVARSFIKKVWSKLIKLVKIPYVHFIIIILFLIFLAINIEDVLSPSRAQKLVVALTKFELIGKADSTDSNPLIRHLRRSLKVYEDEDEIELKGKDYSVVEDTSQARKLGKRVGANIVIWGSIEKTSVEAEIIPRIAIVRPLGKTKLEERQPESWKVSISELEQIEFTKRKARKSPMLFFLFGVLRNITPRNIRKHSMFSKRYWIRMQRFFSTLAIVTSFSLISARQVRDTKWHFNWIQTLPKHTITGG